jgi:hypothetical protein
MKKFICWFLNGHIWPSKWEFLLNRGNGVYFYKECSKCGYKTDKCHEFNELPGWALTAIFICIIGACFCGWVILKGVVKL